jgi:hypothetical protein
MVGSVAEAEPSSVIHWQGGTPGQAQSLSQCISASMIYSLVFALRFEDQRLPSARQVKSPGEAIC